MNKKKTGNSTKTNTSSYASLQTVQTFTNHYNGHQSDDNSSPYLVPQRPQLKALVETLPNFDPNKVFQIQQCIESKQKPSMNIVNNDLISKESIDSSIKSNATESVDESSNLPLIGEYIKLPFSNEPLSSICFEERLVISRTIEKESRKSVSQDLQRFDSFEHLKF